MRRWCMGADTEKGRAMERVRGFAKTGTLRAVERLNSALQTEEASK